MPQAISRRIQLAVGFSLSWLLAAIPLGFAAMLLDDHLIWLISTISSQGYNTSFMQVIETLGILLVRMGGTILLALAGSLLVLLPALSLSWNLVLGCRRSLFLGLRGMLWPTVLHSLLWGMLLSLVAFLYVLMEGLSGFTRDLLPIELLVFILTSLGAWVVLPHSVDNISPEWSMLSGGVSGVLGMLAIAPLVNLASMNDDITLLVAAMCLGCMFAGLLIGLSVPWLLQRDRGFWLELEQGGRTRSFRLGPRPLIVGAFPQAQVQLADAALPALRFSLSGLTLYIEQQGRERHSIVNAPLRIRLSDAELRLRSFDERDDWEEYELASGSVKQASLEDLPDQAAAELDPHSRESIPPASTEPEADTQLQNDG